MKRRILTLTIAIICMIMCENSVKANGGAPYIEGIPLSFDIQEYIWNTGLENEIDPYLIYAMIEVESGYDAGAVSEDNHDYGLMQIRTINHSWINDALDDELDYLNAKDNIAAGIFLLSELYDNYYDNSGIHCVLMAYNMGEGGAEVLWEEGQFSTKYSKKVVDVYEEIKTKGKAYMFNPR